MNCKGDIEMHTRHACASEGDFRAASDSELDALNANNGDLIDTWKNVEGYEVLRRDISFLKELEIVKNSTKFNTHIVKGELDATKRFDPPYDHIIDYQTEGIHTLATPLPNNVLVVKIRRTYPSGFYQAKVRIKAPDGWLNPIDGTVYAQAKDSSCFPDSWSLQKIQQEVAFVIKNRGNELGILTNKGTYFYKGYMTDGRRMAIVSEPNGIIVSAYPYLK